MSVIPDWTFLDNIKFHGGSKLLREKLIAGLSPRV